MTSRSLRDRINKNSRKVSTITRISMRIWMRMIPSLKNPEKAMMEKVMKTKRERRRPVVQRPQKNSQSRNSSPPKRRRRPLKNKTLSSSRLSRTLLSKSSNWNSSPIFHNTTILPNNRVTSPNLNKCSTQTSNKSISSNPTAIRSRTCNNTLQSTCLEISIDLSLGRTIQ